MALYSYHRFTEKTKNFRDFYICIRSTLQQYYGKTQSGYLVGNWSEEAKAFDQMVALYNSDRNDPALIIELRDKTREFANSLQSTYHWVASTFIGSWAADLISTPVGGGGSTLKQSLENILDKFQDLFTVAEQAIEQAKALEVAGQRVQEAQKAAQVAIQNYSKLRATQPYRY